MNAPFYNLGAFGEPTALAIAVGLGVGFGFVLERAGFGSSRRLAAQFYGTDMTVFKVMFTAILTSMVGLYGLAHLGVVDMDFIWINPTYMGPQVVGGLLLGIGFVVSGYCPGTSLVAAASGKLDGLATVGGVILGLLLFGAVYTEGLSEFHHSGGEVETLHQLLGVDPLVLTVALLGVAFLAFVGAEWIESRNGAESASRTTSTRNTVAAGLAVAVTVAILLPSTVPPAAAAPRTLPTVDPLTLAKDVVTGQGQVVVLDLRSAEEFGNKAVPDSRNMAANDLAKPQGWEEKLSPNHRYVLIDGGDGSASKLQAPATYDVAILDGGWPAWDQVMLTPPEPPTDERLRTGYNEHAALVAWLTGAAAPAPKAAAAAPTMSDGAGKKKKKKGGGC